MAAVLWRRCRGGGAVAGDVRPAPTSRDTFLIVGAAALITLTPEASLPVNATLSTPG